jgi:nucleoside-diphosphate-sugar epimerase
MSLSIETYIIFLRADIFLVVAMEVLITGGTGFLGRGLAEVLRREGHAVTLLSRRGGEGALTGDVTRPETLEGLGPFDAVYHLAAALDESLPYRQLHAVNVEGTRHLLRLAEDWEARFLFLSTAGVLGPTPTPASEEAPLNPQTAYERTKAEAEREVMEFSSRRGGEVVVLRPTIVYGCNRHWLKILKAVQRGFPLIGSGKNLFHLLYLKNLLPVMVRILREGNGIYHLADRETLPLETVYEIMARHLGVTSPKSHLPVPLAKALALLYEGASRITGREPFFTRAHVERLVRPRAYDITKAERELGYRPEYDFETGIRETIGEFREKGLL